MSIYWWPEPTTPGGCPYPARWGRNAETDDTARYDASSLRNMLGDVEALTLAFYISGDARYGAHAATDIGKIPAPSERRLSSHGRGRPDGVLTNALSFWESIESEWSP